jgi:WhiB family transcriptional regulator, redox-sensing transcriptional regulator
MAPGDLPELLGPRPAWMGHAACKGEDVSAFVPPQPLRGDAVPDRLGEVCARCPVAPACLAYALARPELQGCWGGTSDGQRRALRRSLAA